MNATSTPQACVTVLFPYLDTGIQNWYSSTHWNSWGCAFKNGPCYLLRQWFSTFQNPPGITFVLQQWYELRACSRKSPEITVTWQEKEHSEYFNLPLLKWNYPFCWLTSSYHITAPLNMQPKIVRRHGTFVLGRQIIPQSAKTGSSYDSWGT